MAILNSSDQRISLSDGEQGMLCDIASEMQTLASDLEAFQHMFCDIVESGQSVFDTRLCPALLDLERAGAAKWGLGYQN